MDQSNSLSTKPQIVLPLVSQTYYGSSVSVENLKPGTKIYIGIGNRIEEVIVDEIKTDEQGYQLHSQQVVYLAFPNTRIQYSSYHK